MEKKQLIDRLVNRKLASGGKDKVICRCVARRLCVAAGQPTGQATAK